MKINKALALKIAAHLKKGGIISNGKVYSLTFDYSNGVFCKVGEDRREGDRFETKLTEDEFVREIQNYDDNEFQSVKNL